MERMTSGTSPSLPTLTVENARTSQLIGAIVGCMLLGWIERVDDEQWSIQHVCYCQGEGRRLQTEFLTYSKVALIKSKIDDGVENIHSTSTPTAEVQRFIVIAKQRSESGFITSLLNKHSSIVCGQEELRNLQIGKLNFTQFTSKIEETIHSLVTQGNNSDCSSRGTTDSN